MSRSVMPVRDQRQCALREPLGGRQVRHCCRHRDERDGSYDGISNRRVVSEPLMWTCTPWRRMARRTCAGRPPRSVVDFRSGSLAGRAMTVVGVMPESMETIGSPMDFYAPIVAAANAGSMGLGPIIGRLRDTRRRELATRVALGASRGLLERVRL
jgi:hypothetical protein